MFRHRVLTGVLACALLVLCGRSSAQALPEKDSPRAFLGILVVPAKRRQLLRELLGAGPFAGELIAVGLADRQLLLELLAVGALLGQHKISVASVPLPAIGCAFGTGAANHPAAATVMTQTTARDVINDHSITLFEASYPGAHPLNDTTRLMTANDSLVCFRSRSPVASSVDGTQIAPTER